MFWDCRRERLESIGYPILDGPIEEVLKDLNLKRQLVLKKGVEKFIFRYKQGQEEALLDAMCDMAKNPESNFDWFDAAVLSFKLIQTLIAEADEILAQ